MAKMPKAEAKRIAQRNGISFKGDYHREVSMSQSGLLAELAHKVGYRKPPNANGSLGRYFYYHLMKVRE